VVFHLDWLALRPLFSPGHRQPTQLLALLRVHADPRLGAGLMVLALARRLNATDFNGRPTVGATSGDLAGVSSSARYRNDFIVHRNGDSGSPRSSGSTNASSAFRRPEPQRAPLP
jgi:hypothetical protein